MSKENELLTRLTEFFFEHAVECEEDIYQSEFVEEDSLELIEDLFSIVKSKNRTCNCQHNNTLKNNESCCRCDSRKTNADKIRNMSDEELSEFLDVVEENGISSQYTDVPCDCCCEKTACDECWKEWLQSEAE